MTATQACLLRANNIRQQVDRLTAWQAIDVSKVGTSWRFAYDLSLTSDADSLRHYAEVLGNAGYYTLSYALHEVARKAGL